MKEKSIIIDSYFKYDFANLKVKLKNTQKCLILTENETSDRYTLMFACEDAHMQTLENIVAHYIANFYATRYKKFYLKRYLNLQDVETMYVPAYICALNQFDTFTDMEIALSGDYSKGTISVIPYLYFKLPGLLERWKTIINLTNENISSFNKSNAIIDLLRYLVKNLQRSKKELNLQFTEYGIKMFDGNILSFETKTQDKSDIANMIATIIKISPQIIVVKSANANSHLETIRRIFAERIVF